MVEKKRKAKKKPLKKTDESDSECLARLKKQVSEDSTDEESEATRRAKSLADSPQAGLCRDGREGVMFSVGPLSRTVCVVVGWDALPRPLSTTPWVQGRVCCGGRRAFVIDRRLLSAGVRYRQAFVGWMSNEWWDGWGHFRVFTHFSENISADSRKENIQKVGSDKGSPTRSQEDFPSAIERVGAQHGNGTWYLLR